MPKTPTLKSLVQTAGHQGNPLQVLTSFLEDEAKHKQAGLTEKMRFVGYVLELGYEVARIITSDPYKIAVGGIPRGSFLIMAPTDQPGLPPHFSLLRVTGVSPTPLSQQVQQTYFELHKRSMPDLDIWTQGELQWGALDCDVLGMFYPDRTDKKKLAFSGDVNNVVSAHRYEVYAPDEKLLDLIVNGMVQPDQRFVLGELRTMECRLFSADGVTGIPVSISMQDFRGSRTAMFGKTRLGKSNVVKLIAQGMIDATAKDKSAGQLIFDINGEYANDNPQDGNRSIRSANADRCQVYALTLRPGTEGWAKPLRLNFYEQAESCFNVIRSMLALDNRTAVYVQSFANVTMPSVASIAALPDADKTRPVRRVQLYWAILSKAGFPADEGKLRGLGLVAPQARHFDPHFHDKVRKLVYEAMTGTAPPSQPNSLHELVAELEVFAKYAKEKDATNLTSTSGKPLFDADDLALLNFLAPKGAGAGPTILRAYLDYHSPNAGDFIADVLSLLDAGQTVILDLGNATDELRQYFADMLSRAVFNHQEKKFISNKLGSHFIQLYFEEAHNLFPVDDKDLTGVYARFAKEGAKFHIGMVYSTQSPSTINRELLAQTENFFVGHMSSQDETKALARVQVAFAGHEQDILRAKTRGFMRMLTQSHRFVIPVQARKFEAAPA